MTANALATLWIKLCAAFVLASCLFGLFSGLFSGVGAGWALDRAGDYFLRSIFVLLIGHILAGPGWIVFFL